MKRTLSGVEDLEKLIGGGIPEKNMVLVSGDYGTGKTTLALQFVSKGVSEFGELGVFTSFANDRGEILEIGKQYGWQLKRFLREGLVSFDGTPPSRFKDSDQNGEELLEEIEGEVGRMDADRLVIDGLGEFSKFFENETEFKAGLAGLRENLRKQNCTSLITSRGRTDVKNLVDGVIILHYDGGLEKTRAVEVKKMRRTAHTDRMCPFEITERGMVVTGPPKEESGEK